MTKHRTDHWYPTGTLAEPYLPQEISRAQQAFPAGIEGLMPPASQIPDEFLSSRSENQSAQKWLDFFESYFDFGLDSLEFDPKPGIDPQAAWTHVVTIMGSFQPKHQYKRAACAYLLSLWFKDVRWTRKKLRR